MVILFLSLSVVLYQANAEGMLSKNDSPPTSEKALIIEGTTFLLSLRMVLLSLEYVHVHIQNEVSTIL